MTQTKLSRPSLLDDAAHQAPAAGPASASAGLSPERRKVIFATVAAVAAVGLLAYVVTGAVAARRNDPGLASRIRAVIDSETGKAYPEFRVPDEASIPFRNPDTGRDTLYPAEACYWTKDGKAKLEPTWVLLNSYVGREGPTQCPDCGRPVVGHNPLPPVELLEEAAKAAGKN